MRPTVDVAGAAGERSAITATFFCNGLGIGAWAASIPAFQARLGLSDARLALVLLAFAAGAVIAMPTTGLLTPRLGTGHATRLSGLLFAATLVPPWLAPTLPLLAIGAFILGVANGCLDVSMNAHASSLETRRRVPIMSSFHAAFSAGGLAGALAGAALTSAGAGSASSLPLAATFIALATLACWSACGRGERTAASHGLTWPSRAILPLGIAALLCMLGEGAMGDWSAVFLATVTHAGAGIPAMGYAAFSLCMLAGRLSGDRVVRMLSRRRVIQAGGTLAACGLLLAAVAPTPSIAILGFALVGLGLSNVVPAVFSAAGGLGPSGAAGIAMAATAGYAGFLSGPPLVGFVAEAAGLRTAMALLAVATIGVALLGRSMRAV